MIKIPNAEILVVFLFVLMDDCVLQEMISLRSGIMLMCVPKCISKLSNVQVFAEYAIFYTSSKKKHSQEVPNYAELGTSPSLYHILLQTCTVCAYINKETNKLNTHIQPS